MCRTYRSCRSRGWSCDGRVLKELHQLWASVVAVKIRDVLHFQDLLDIRVEVAAAFFHEGGVGVPKYLARWKGDILHQPAITLAQRPVTQPSNVSERRGCGRMGNACTHWSSALNCE